MLFGLCAGSFNPEKDIPSLEGKVVLVTGGNIGLGQQAVLEFARHNPRQIWLGARNLVKARAAVDEIQKQVHDAPIKILHMDLSSFESVKKAAKRFSAESDRLDILMLNAGVMATAPGELTMEGYEMQFGTNHMGHALFTKLLLPVLDKTAKSGPATDVRIVSLSSALHKSGPKQGIVFESLKTTDTGLSPVALYCQSKLANFLFARHLAKLYPQFTIAAVHPGVVRTNLVSGASGMPAPVRMIGPVVSYFLSSVDQGVRNQLWASVSKDVVSGEYYEPVGVGGKCRPLGKDDGLAKRLWDWTERELAEHGATNDEE
ncbi:Short-chain dehydrogenase/reductase [Tolypocladium paradoxum]|uniref:Short-chain dehydrogenase/reductase n=1 Tax=Tolypocladium paradoxum TaxID=94208 RepID=A0A2S4L1A9_9HYPO|nr:Short-chain dehydrogenase/reductase [Tolypocladium paradoxum]